MTTTTKGHHVIIEATHYREEAERLAIDPLTICMFIELPSEIIIKLRAGEHIPGFMEAANAEWRRRNAASGQPCREPDSLGGVLRALQFLAEC
jgi:hypothetical protein